VDRAGAAMKRTVTAIATLACILHAFAAAAAPPCRDDRPGDGAPARVPVQGPADLGVPQEACARTALYLEGRGALLVATDEFYGSILTGLSMRGTAALPWLGSWVSLYVPGLEARYVANATVDRWKVSLGGGAVGGHVPLGEVGPVTVVGFARALLPTETVFVNARRYGVEPGLSARWVPTPNLEVLGGLASTSTWTVVPGRARYVFDPVISADTVYRPFRAGALVAGVSVRPLESVDWRAQMRLYPYRELSLSMGVAVPSLGRDRTDAATSLSLGWDGL